MQIALTLVGALVAAVAVLIAPVPRRSWGAVTLALLAALAAYTALSIAWSLSPAESWADANRMLSYVAVFAAAVAFARLAPAHWPALLKAVGLACLAVSLYGLTTKVFPGALNADEVYGRLREPFGYWNAVGIMAALGVPPLLWLGARPQAQRLTRTLVYPALGLMLVTALLSYSRGALFALGAGLAFWFAVVPLRLRAAALLAPSAIGAALLAAWAFGKDELTNDGLALGDRIVAGQQFGLLIALLALLLYGAGWFIAEADQQRALSEPARRKIGIGLLAGTAAITAVMAVALSSGGGGASSAWSRLTDPDATVPKNEPGRLTTTESIRARYWRDAVRIFEGDALLGAGAASYATARQRHKRDGLEVRYAHGYIPQTLADLGLVGLALSIGLLGAWLAAAARVTGLRLRDRGQPFTPQQIGLLTLATVVLVFGVHSVFDWTWFVPGPAIVALACAGFVAGRRPLFEDGPGTSRTLAWRARVGLAAGILVVALATAWAIWQPQRSAEASQSAQDALAGNRLDQARADALNARERNPLSVEPLFTLAAIEDSLGRRDAARRTFQGAVRLQPANSTTWLLLAEYELHVLRQPLPALSELRAAAYLNPRSQRIREQFVIARRTLQRSNESLIPATTRPSQVAPLRSAPPGGRP